MLPSTFEVFGAVPSLRYANRCEAGRPPETGGKTHHGGGPALGHGFVEAIDMNIYQFGNRVGSSGSQTLEASKTSFVAFGNRVGSSGSQTTKASDGLDGEFGNRVESAGCQTVAAGTR